jgi:hypothetical protein
VNFDSLRQHHERAVRSAILDGLSVLRSRDTQRMSFDYFNVMHQLALRLLAAPDAAQAAQVWNGYQADHRSDPQRKNEEHPDNRKILSALWGLIAEGILFPRLKNHSRDGHPLLIDTVTLTARGERVLAGGDDHPLHPGFIRRFRQRAPELSDEVVARMEDAVSCVEKSLLRAALVMVGLAVEETLRVTHASMVNLACIGKTASAMKNAKDVLDEIENAVQSWPNQNDEQHRLKMALAAAESIRTERNKASHPGAVVDDAPAVEELLVLAGRQIPTFWEIPIQQAVKTNGFVIP